MSLTEAFLTESGGMRGLEAGSNRVREDYGAVPAGGTWSDNDFSAASMAAHYQSLADSTATWDTSVPSQLSWAGGYGMISALRLDPATSDDQYIKVTASFPPPNEYLHLATHRGPVMTASDGEGYQCHVYGALLTDAWVYFFYNGEFRGNPAVNLGANPVNLDWRVVNRIGTLRVNGVVAATCDYTSSPQLTGRYQSFGNWGMTIYDAEGGNYGAAPPSAGVGSAVVTWGSTVAAVGAKPGGGGGALYTDNFDRADGALTTPWVNYEGIHSIGGNKITVGDRSPTVSVYNATFATDQWSEADITGIFSAAPPNEYTDAAVTVRATGPSGDLYYLWPEPNNAVSIYKRVGGAYTNLLDRVSRGTTVQPFKGRLEIQGTTLRAYINGALVGTTTDASIATGKPGILTANGPGATLDNWRGGDMPYTPPANLYVGYRSFDGTDAVLLDIAESVSDTFAAMTWVACVRRTGRSPSTYGTGTFLTAASAAGTLGAYWYSTGNESAPEMDWGPGGYTQSYDAGQVIALNEWLIVACSKAAGSNQPFRVHRYLFSTSTWTHVTTGGNVNPTTAPGAGGHWVFGNNQNNDEGLLGDIAAGAVWGSQLSDLQIETMSGSLASWAALSPRHLWRLDQTTIADIIGNADQTSVFGTPNINGGNSPLKVS